MLYYLVKNLHKFAAYITKLMILLVPSSRNIFITFITIDNFPESGVKYQVERTHNKVEYLQDLRYHKKVLAPKIFNGTRVPFTQILDL